MYLVLDPAPHHRDRYEGERANIDLRVWPAVHIVERTSFVPYCLLDSFLKAAGLPLPKMVYSPALSRCRAERGQDNG